MPPHEPPTILLVIVCLIVAPFSYYWINVARRKKQMLRFRVKRAVVGETIFLLTAFILVKNGYQPYPALFFGLMTGLAASFILVRYPNRNRRIPRYVREAVISRDLKGMPFDPKLHQLDHIVPFSKGGDHSVQNLRVLPKIENLRRGARMPKIRDFR